MCVTYVPSIDCFPNNVREVSGGIAKTDDVWLMLYKLSSSHLQF